MFKKMKRVYQENKIVHEVVDLCVVFVECYVCVFLFTTFLFKPIQVHGESMVPTYQDGNIGLTNIIMRNLESLERFDVVVVDSPLEVDDHWIKRIIGLPNETIEFKDDVLYIDGEEVVQSFFDEAYVASEKQMSKSGLFTENFGPYTLADDEYFLAGDNRRHSTDSRVVGPFKSEHIMGKDAYIFIH